MVPVKTNTINVQEGVESEVGFTAKIENLGVIFNILRNQLYSDPIMAVIREYSCNSADAHVAAGKPKEPIVVTFPTVLESFFKVRDFGLGLDDNGIQEIFASYGESTKRNDQKQTGMLGIGCKSGFAYGDSFMVNSYKDGTLTAWNAYIDPSQQGKMAKMATVETKEPNGIEIVIPVKTLDMHKFHEKAFQFFAYFQVEPVFHNVDKAELAPMLAIRNRPTQFKGNDWKFFGSGTSYAVMGNIAYPIHAHVFTESELSSSVRQILSHGLVVDFKLGQLEFAASREALQYTPFTKKNLSHKLTAIVQDLIKEASQTFANCKTLWEARCLYREVFDLNGKLYNIRNFFTNQNQLTYNGVPINGNRFSVRSKAIGDIEASLYIKNPGAKMRRQQASVIEAHATNFVVFNDTDICNGIINRLAPIIEAGPKYNRVFVLKFKTDQVKADWLKESGYDGPSVSLKSLPKEPLSKYYGSLMSTGTGFGSPKHISQEFVYSPKTNRLYSSKSDFWEVEKIDVSTESGVYLELDRFEYLDHNNYLQHPTNMSTILDKLKAVGIASPLKIHGLKPASAFRAKANPKMVTLWKWIKTAVADYMTKHPELAQEFADRDYVQGTVSNWVSDISTMSSTLAKWPMVKGKLREFCDSVKKVYTFDATKLDRVAQVLTIGRYKLATVKPSFDLKHIYNDCESKYPLLFRIASLAGNYRLDNSAYLKPLQDYITLVDEKSPTGVIVNEGEGI